ASPQHFSDCASQQEDFSPTQQGAPCPQQVSSSVAQQDGFPSAFSPQHCLDLALQQSDFSPVQQAFSSPQHAFSVEASVAQQEGFEAQHEGLSLADSPQHFS